MRLLPPRISEIPRFCLRRKSLHLLSKFSPPEATRLQLVFASHTIEIMLTICLSNNVLRITFARKDEAVGNYGLPSGANGLQARQEAQDFRRDFSLTSVACSVLQKYTIPIYTKKATSFRVITHDRDAWRLFLDALQSVDKIF